MPQITVQTKVSGPFFTLNVPTVIVGAIDEGIKDTVAEGERDIKLQLYPGHGQDTGRYKGSIHGEMVKSLHGVVHSSGAGGKPVIYETWLEGVSSRNQTTRFKGYAMYRNAFQRLQLKVRGFIDQRVAKALRMLN